MKKNNVSYKKLFSKMFDGGLIFGFIGFILGFIGPIIFAPEANQGPLLGIFFTGPIGFFIGVLSGAGKYFFKLNK